MNPEIFYSMVDGRPQQRRRLDPRPPLYRNQLVDALRRSVQPDDADTRLEKSVHTSIRV